MTFIMKGRSYYEKIADHYFPCLTGDNRIVELSIPLSLRKIFNVESLHNFVGTNEFYYFDTIMKDMSYEQIATIFRAGLISSSFFINPHRFYLCAIPMDSLPKPCSAIFVISVRQDSS